MKNRMLKGSFVGVLVISLLFTACGGGNVLSPGGSGGDDGYGDGGTDEGGGTGECGGTDECGGNPSVTSSGSSTTVANPVIINLKGATGLVLEDKQNDNFKKIVDGELEPVLEISSSSSVDKAMVPQTIPGISSFVQGPNNELIIWLKESIVVGDVTSCNVIYYRESDEKTICASPLNSEVQFDTTGNVYFKDDSGIIVRWTPDTNMRQNLTNQYIYVKEWLVHSAGDIFVNGTAGGANIFRRITIDDSAEDYLNGSDTVTSFRFVDREHILMDGIIAPETVSATYILTVLGPQSGNVEQLSLPNSYYYHGSINEFQQSSDGIFYAKGGYLAPSKIVAVYPGAPHAIPLNLTGLRSFKIVDLNLYVIGQRNTKHVLVLNHLNENEEGVDLLGSNNLEVYDFILVNEWLYFNALRLADNKIVFGEVNLNTRELNIIDETLGKKYLQMETRKSVRNESFSAVDDIRSLLKPPFESARVDRDIFKNLGKVKAIEWLKEDYSNYLAVIAGTKIHFFDMTHPDDPQQVSELDVLSVDNTYVPHVRQSGPCVFVSGLFNNYSFPSIECVDVNDIENPVLRASNELMLGAWGDFLCDGNLVVGHLHVNGVALGVELWNFSDVSSPSEITSFLDVQSGNTYSWSIDSVSYAEISPAGLLQVLATKDNQRGIYSFDVSDLANVKLVAFLPLNISPESEIHAGTDLFTWEDGALSVFDVGNDYSSASNVSKTTIWNSDLTDLVISGSYGFLRKDSQLFVMNLENLEYPRLVQIEDAVKSNVYSIRGDNSQFVIYLGTDSGLTEMHLTKKQ